MESSIKQNEDTVEEKRICEKLQKNFSLTREAAEEELRSFMEEKAKNQEEQ